MTEPGETESILKHFMRETDFSRWGLANAVTRTANDTKGLRQVACGEVMSSYGGPLQLSLCSLF